MIDDASPAPAQPGATLPVEPARAVALRRRAADMLLDQGERLRAIETYRAALHALVTFEQRAALPTITVPTLCLAGEHDSTASPTVVRRMAEKIPGARYLELHGAGHLMNFEQPEAFTEALLGFLHTTQEETQP